MEQKNHYLEKFYTVNETSLQNFLNDNYNEINEFYNQRESILEILKYYPYKGLVSKATGHLEITKNLYQNLVIDFLISKKRTQMVEIMQKYLPDIK
jgi:hypothetical protein